MRLIHTSDWHLGQLFYQYDRAEEHDRFLAWLSDTLSHERADALLIAGDVFDHANPSAVAQRQFYQFLTDAKRRQPHLSIVVVSGNHDSPGRLEAPAPFFDALGITVVGQVPRQPHGELDTARLVVPLKDRTGAVAAWCLAVPFLRTGDLHALDGETVAPTAQADTGVGPRGAYGAGVARLYERAMDEAAARRGGNQALVALGHCSVEGGVMSRDSERPILAGGLDALAPDLFDRRLAYVALGHLHRPQSIRGDERLRYSGSPMALSFTEIDYPHQVVCVDLDGSTLGGVRAIPVPRFAPLLRIPEVHSPPGDVIAALQGLDVAEAGDGLRPFVEVRVLIDSPEPGLRARIEEALTAKPVRLARIDTTYTRTGQDSDVVPPRSLEDLATLRPDAVFVQLYRERFGTETPPEFMAAFGELLRTPATEGQS